MNPIRKKKPGPAKLNYFATTITLPRELLDRVRARARTHNVPHTDIYRAALEAYLKVESTDDSNG